jgi:hypothetical protein
VVRLFDKIKKNKVKRFVVDNQNDIEMKIIPHFEKYALNTSKKLNFDDFKKAFYLFKQGQHKTNEGLSKITEIKANMNKGRSFEDKFNSVQSNQKLILHPN